MKTKLYPSIRFSSYVEEWTIQKFKDYTVKTGKKNSHNENYPAYSVNNKLGLVSQTEQFDGSRLENLSKESYKFVEPNEFAYNPARINVGSIAFNNLSETVLVSSLYVVIKMSTKIDNEYILQYIKSPIFNYEVKRNTEGSVREYLFYENFKNIKFPLPSVKEEQIKIGSFFKTLDETISLHQQELEALKQTKQGFLQKMFPQNEETVPELRFGGFSEGWSKEKLANLADFSKGSGYSKGDLITEGTPILLYGQLYTNYKSIISSVSNYVIEKEKSVISFGDEVVVPASGESSEDIARASAVTVPGVIIGGDLNIIRPTNKIEPIFLALALSNGKIQRELSKFAQGKSVVHLQNSEIKKVQLLFPEIEEQIKIGEFFRQLDEVIELKEKELEALKETKKGFLQKMFV